MFDPMKVAELKKLGFTDADIRDLQTQAEATEKSAMSMGIAYKATTAAADSAGDVEIPGEIDDKLIALYEQHGNDWDAVGAALDGLATPATVEQKRTDTRTGPMRAGGQMDNAPSLLNQKKKVYNPAADPFAVVLQADQLRRR